MDEQRLNTYLAFQLGISRREADAYIARGSVTINGITAPLGARILPGDTLLLNGAPLPERDHFSYVLLHKPVGYVSSRRQQGDAPTLYELLPKKYHHLKTVGRLDKNSSGLLLLSDDGTFTYQMTHPKFHKTKHYEVGLDTPLEPLHQQMITDYGVQLEDGPSKLILERQDESRTKWAVTMHEGRNRQIRRTFSALGYTVTRLHRTVFGPYRLDDLPAGSYRETTRQ